TPRGNPAQTASPALSAFTGWTNGYDPVATQIAYDYLRGRDFNGDNHFDPTTLRYTTYMVPGDPVAPTGWVDDAPGDKRFLVGNGEIDFAPGDTQVVIAAVIVGQGDNPLTSISDLRETAAASRVLFLRGFDTPFPLTLDLQPDRCPNELIDPLHALPAPRPAAADGGNIVPVMLAGSEAFDAIQIDGTSLRLNGLAPLSAAVRYADTRTLGDSPCDCESSAHDAYADLYLRFDATALFAALAPATNDEHREVTLTGVSKSGFPIIATDCVRLRRFTDAAVGTPRPNDRDHTLEFRNAPNPFNAATVLSITLPEQAFVRVEVFDILGRRVRRLADGAFAAGTTQLTWEGTGDNGRPLPSGVYFARLSTGEKQIYRKLILLK
ncbi:MAG TPA: T9SS type A sorting domain-containing protein, partial [candidate division Zixibacteria bacterium]|nr:T9SS type A sorting domain-containing protein [candidate division Zixibacteria bacterium]